MYNIFQHGNKHGYIMGDNFLLWSHIFNVEPQELLQTDSGCTSGFSHSGKLLGSFS